MRDDDGRGLKPHAVGQSEDRLRQLIDEAADGLLRRQAEDGHWLFELEADATIPAEYILLNHFLGEIDDDIERKLAVYLRDIQGDHGGWPLYHKGDFDISATVKAYYALKMVGDDIEAPHMRRAREAILERGGAAKANVFTRTTLALFEQVPWRAVPVMRVELLLLPRWTPFTMDKVAYWSRTVMVPLLVLATLRARAENPRGIGIPELFVRPPQEEEDYLVNPTGHWLGEVMLRVDRVVRLFEPIFPKVLERKAIARALDFVTERLNGEDGLGGIFPAMANALMVFHHLGIDRDDPRVVTARKAVDGLLAIDGERAYCQPCLSPVWDTGLAYHALQEAGLEADSPSMAAADRWLRGRQIVDLKGDWAAHRPQTRPGGWAFQYRNDYYPDVDDTAVVVMALNRAANGQSDEAQERAAEWIVGMQSRNGGWGAFDADNEYYFLNNIPFADHGALLDPPTVDVTARCISMLAQLGKGMDEPAVARGVEFIRRNQEPEGSWFGRWGTNYIYGTWSALCALNAAGEDMSAPYVRKAVDWLVSQQHADGGWGEDCGSYWSKDRIAVPYTTPSQTAWALLALMAAGEVDSEAVRRGIEFLVRAPRDGGTWDETHFNAVGFPRVFYLRYHGYAAYFPLWALARYHNLRNSNIKRTSFGM